MNPKEFYNNLRVTHVIRNQVGFVGFNIIYKNGRGEEGSSKGSWDLAKLN